MKLAEILIGDKTHFFSAVGIHTLHTIGLPAASNALKSNSMGDRVRL